MPFFQKKGRNVVIPSLLVAVPQQRGSLLRGVENLTPMGRRQGILL